MTRSPALHDAVSRAILESAAKALAEVGPRATMGDIASEAGIGRATLYRYFPNREILLQSLSELAVHDLADRIHQAKLETLPPSEALARTTRACFAVVAEFRGLGADLAGAHKPKIDQEIAAQVRGIFVRGIERGEFRSDLSPDLLFETYVSLLEGTSTRLFSGRYGIEELSAAITSLFLDGLSVAASTRSADH